ncbi:MAG TPA: hypothetical protein VGE01_00060 [Fimbriimonas sp.]
MRLASMLLMALLARGASAEVRWFGNADRALQAARNEGKLVMLDLVNPPPVVTRRGPRFQDSRFDAPRVEKAVAAFVPLRLQAKRDGKKFAERFKVGSFPTVLFLDAGGSAVWRISGPTGPDSFLVQFRKAKGMARSLPAYRRAYRTRKGSVDELGGAGILAAAANDVAAAEALVRLATARDPKVKNVRLADACNMLGDCHQNAGRYAAAIPLFRKAAANADDDTKSYALISIASCYLSLRDRKAAAPWLQKLVEMGPRAGEYGPAAKNLLSPHARPAVP